MSRDLELAVDLLALASHPHDVAGAQETMRKAADRLAAFDALPAEDVVERVARAIERHVFIVQDSNEKGREIDYIAGIEGAARAAIAALPASPALEGLRELIREKSQGDAVYYLRSIARQLESLQDLVTTSESFYGPTISSEILADNLDWLGCFVDSVAGIRAELKRGDE